MWLCRSEADHRDKLLACGALIVAELRMQVFRETEFTCSAGIAHNKVGSLYFLYFDFSFLPACYRRCPWKLGHGIRISLYDFVSRCWPNWQVP